jgi:tRNA-dihydrouridine synthase A
MLDVSTVEFRYFMRLLTKRAILWTEMVVAETLVHRSLHNTVDDEDIQLDMELIRHCGWFDERDHYDCPSDAEFVDPHPIVCQIGTNDAKQAAFATRVVQACGYDRIDLNVECPSDRVAGREFGAALMRDHSTAVEVVRSMVNTSNSGRCMPVSVKTRIGVDEFDSFEHLVVYVQNLVDVGCRRFVVHARKVYTQGLSPAQNRTVPPLNYPCVYKLMECFPQCDFWLNGYVILFTYNHSLACCHRLTMALILPSTVKVAL